MVLYFAKKIYANIIVRKDILTTNLHTKKIRKAKLSPPRPNAQKRDTGTSFFAPLQGSLTIEAALILPIFLFFMIAAIQYAAVMETAVKFGSALADTGKNIATAAYVATYGGETKEAPELATAALSAAYAKSRVTAQAGDTSTVKNMNMLLSTFLQEEDEIDLVLTYQIRSPIGSVRLPGNFFIQRARLRAWTGRIPAGEKNGTTGEDAAEDYVYVTETGTVYHEDPECTHLRLSVQAVDIGALATLRNNHGAIYHNCEKCASRPGSSTVYITEEGNRYHNSISCSGLKRTVRQISRKELGGMRVCSRCKRG